VTSDARKGENEAWFRELNELLEERAARTNRADETFEIVCECAREECTQRIPISFAAYEAVRSESTTFVVMPGHLDPTCERMVSDYDRFQVVEKFGESGELADVENPRDG
jgi:hypothetical protein